MSKPDDAPPMRMLPHGSTRIHLAGPEAGPRVLLVHGMTYPLEVWEPLATDLSTAGYRVARYDLYGRGEADWDGVALSPAALADQAYAVLDLLDWQGPVCWVSLSNSDLVLLWAANLRPERCCSLQFLAPSGFDRRLMNPRMRFVSRLPASASWLGGRLRRACIKRMRGHRSHLNSAMEQRVGAVYDRAMHWAENNTCFAGAVSSQIRHLPSDESVQRQLEQLNRRDIPIFALGFGEEADSSESGLAPFLGALSRLQRTTLASGSHMGLLEYSDSVTSWVIAGLRTTGCVSGCT